jgi:glycosyltransferase involved in cell wall biosynthesis
LAHGLVEPERTIIIQNGVHPSCSPEDDPVAQAEAARLLGTQCPANIEILHVGSTIPRKRIDLLLEIFAAVKAEFPQARLIRVGGSLTPEQIRLAEQLGVTKSLVVLPQLRRDVLAAVYRRASVLLLPSEREGFGLPVIEALACGTPVVASDIAVLREAGGDAASYCAVGDVSSWANSIRQLLIEFSRSPSVQHERRTRAIAQAAKFSWAEYARKTVAVYEQLM